MEVSSLHTSAVSEIKRGRKHIYLLTDCAPMAFQGFPHYGVNILLIRDENYMHIGCALFPGFGNCKLHWRWEEYERKRNDNTPDCHCLPWPWWTCNCHRWSLWEAPRLCTCRYHHPHHLSWSEPCVQHIDWAYQCLGWQSRPCIWWQAVCGCWYLKNCPCWALQEHGKTGSWHELSNMGQHQVVQCLQEDQQKPQKEAGDQSCQHQNTRQFLMHPSRCCQIGECLLA